MKRLTLLLMSLVATSMALATTYVRVEKDGSKTYSDRPLPGGQPVELDPVQTYSAPKTDSSSSSSSSSSRTNSNLPADQRALQGIDDFTYSSCTLSPANDETFTNPESVTVSVALDPAIRPGDRVNLVVDDRPAGDDVTTIRLQPVERGSHTASVDVKDTYGRTLCSARVTFSVFQPSVIPPRRR